MLYLTALLLRQVILKPLKIFSLAVSSLVGLLSTMDNVAASELQCGSHVDRLLTKLPPSYRDSFIEYCITRGIIRTGSSCTYNMYDFSEWLERSPKFYSYPGKPFSHKPSDRPRPERATPEPLQGPGHRISLHQSIMAQIPLKHSQRWTLRHTLLIILPLIRRSSLSHTAHIVKGQSTTSVAV